MNNITEQNSMPARTNEENTLLFLDERIEYFRNLVSLDDNPEEYDQNLATMYAIMRYRESVLAPIRETPIQKSEKAGSDNAFWDPALFALMLFAMTIGIILGAIIF